MSAPKTPFDFGPLVSKAYGATTDDAEFYIKATKILMRPTRLFVYTTRLLNLAFYILVIGSIAWLGAQILDRDYPVTIVATDIANRIVPAGEPIRVHYTVERYRSCRTTLYWTVIDGEEELHEYGPVIVEATGLPGHDSYVRAFSTSKNLAPGDGVLRVAVSWQCPGNYIQGLFPVHHVLDGEHFTIVPQLKPQGAQ